MRKPSYLLGWLLSGCAAAVNTAVNTEPLTLAVWGFENNSLSTSEDVDHFEHTLPELLLEDLSHYRALRLVDRQNLARALEEQKLGGSELVSLEDRLRLGRIVGASAMLFGSYVVVDDQIRIDVRLVDVSTAVTRFSKAMISSLASVETEMHKVAEDLGKSIASP